MELNCISLLWTQQGLMAKMQQGRIGMPCPKELLTWLW